MNKYIATFYSHFGAMSYKQALKKQNIAARLMPSPRELSSSCGSCVYYEHDLTIDLNDCELDSIYTVINDELNCVLKKT